MGQNRGKGVVEINLQVEHKHSSQEHINERKMRWCWAFLIVLLNLAQHLVIHCF